MFYTVKVALFDIVTRAGTINYDTFGSYWYIKLLAHSIISLVNHISNDVKGRSHRKKIVKISCQVSCQEKNTCCKFLAKQLKILEESLKILANR